MSSSNFPAPGLSLGGAWQLERAQTLPVLNPANGEELAHLPMANAADIEQALQIAQRVWPLWRGTSTRERARILKNAADWIRARRESIAHTLTLEQGKPLAESLVEVDYTAEIFEWYGEEARRLYGRIVPARQPLTRQMVLPEAVGPVAAFTPWNFPALTPARKLAGALAAGCPIILKPAEETPATACWLMRALEESGLPAGAAQLLFGEPDFISRALIASPIIRKISFTGSTVVGKHLAALAAQGLKRCTFELGGHAPVLVLDDADIDAAIALCVMQKYRNAGQVCVSPTRFIVTEKHYAHFAAGFAAGAAVLPVGDGLKPENKMGPLANARRVASAESMVQDALQKGAKLLAGGQRLGNAGFFYAPTVLADLPTDARILHEEPFAPVAPIIKVADMAAALTEANRLPYGLAAYAFTKSQKNAAILADNIESGMLAINHFGVSTPETPFGGIKDSGYGSEGGLEGIQAYLTPKFVSVLEQ